MRKKSLSCVNIRRKFDTKNLSCSNKFANGDNDAGIFVCTKRIDDDEGILPLLEKAGSLSSFNSFTPATEESFLESSADDGPTKSDYERRRQKARRATTGKIRCLKHRPHSISLSDRNLTRLQESNILKEKNGTANQQRSEEDIDEDEKQISVTTVCAKKNLRCGADQNVAELTLHQCCTVGMTRKQRRSLKSNNNCINNNFKTTTTCPSSPTEEDKTTIDNLSDSNNNNNNNTSGSDVDAQISFSKEQRKRLKQRMRERQKFQDKSVFLGLF